mgnify:CR=1 FL=1
MTLGEKLKDARKQASLSQEQLAERLGVSRSAVAKWETDNGIPDVGNLKVIAQLLDVSIDYLLDDSEGMDVLCRRTGRAASSPRRIGWCGTSSRMGRFTPFWRSRS